MAKKIRLKDLRYEAIAEGTGIDVPYLSRILSGTQRISETTIGRFADLLGCSRVEAYKQIEEARKIKQSKKESTEV